jgi:hypothetical protein
MMRVTIRRLLWMSCVLVAAASPALAQDFRGSIVGTVVDTTGAAIPGATVKVVNVETQVTHTAVTDERGVYSVLLLNPGKYNVTATLQGFKTFVREGQLVAVAETVRIEISLATGTVEETITVQAEAPLLNTNSGISGILIDSKQIVQLPLGDGTAYMLTRLAPGIMDSSDLHFARPMDNGNLGGIVTNGVLGGNEFTIDGAPNLSNAKGVGFSPPSDAIAQFKVQTNAFDAQAGHTAGAVVNLALKSGTNSIRGAGGYFNRDASRTATPLLTERAGGTKPSRTYNRFTGQVGGPVLRNRTFYMVAYEHLRDVQPEPSTFTVPTEKMRVGDFSEFTSLIYDPLTATGTTRARTAFTDNKIPSTRIDPVAGNIAAMYPLPNRPGTIGNYFTNMLRPYDYDAIMGRVDHNLSGNDRAFVSLYYNTRQEDRYNWAAEAANATNNGTINNVLVTQGFDYRSNRGLTLGYTTSRFAMWVVDVRYSNTTFGEYRDPAQNVDPASLGFAPSAVQAMQGYQYLPMITFAQFSTTNQNSTIASLGSQRSDWNAGFNRPMTTNSFLPTLTRIWGDHNLKLGYELRHQRWLIENAGYGAGRYHFNGAYTRASNSAGTNDRAQSFAQFLLGLPTVGTNTVANSGSTSSQFEISSPGEFSQRTQGVFLQDDWQVTDRLSLNLGLRVEFNGGMTEKSDRNLGGFDTVTPNPLDGPASAAYANNPIPQIPVSEFGVIGGLLFADGPINKSKAKALPRAAAAYRIGERTVIRGGVGLFSYDYFFENINQAGFSQPTPVQVTTDDGLTFTGATLSNPLPSGQLIQPVGSANGLMSSLGQSLGTLYQPERETPYYTRWELGLQRDLGAGWVAAFTYLGSRGSNLPVVRQFNNIPIEFLSTSRFRDTANETVLSSQVANPFAGLVPGTTFNGATVQRNVLLRPYPHFGTFAVEVYEGSDSYESATVQLQKRFRGGNSLTMQYTKSSTRDKLNYLNPPDGILEDRVSPNDRPHRFSIGSSLQLPFGKGERWGSDWTGVTDAVLGGWRLSGTYQYQSGFPLTWGNLYYDAACDPMKLTSNIGKQVAGGIAGLDVPGWDVSCFYFHDSQVQTGGVDDINKQRADGRINVGNIVRYFPSTLPGVRTHHLNLLDFSFAKSFSLPRSMVLQIRVEFINALNYTVLWNPGVDPRATSGLFGVVNQDRNNPRDIQFGLRLTF